MFDFYIQEWAAIAPGLTSRDEWTKWGRGEVTLSSDPAEPDVGFVPANMRRRMSTLTRLLFAAGQQCAPQRDVRTVLASRHGEIHRAVELLHLVNAGEEISPMSFGLSVHNAGIGLYSMFTGSTAPSTAVAAGEDTFVAGLVEALGFLDEDYPEVLLIFADRILPEEYQGFDSPDAVDLALALLISKDSGMQVSARISPEKKTYPENNDIIGFVRWLLSSDRQISVGSNRLRCQFEKNA